MVHIQNSKKNQQLVVLKSTVGPVWYIPEVWGSWTGLVDRSGSNNSQEVIVSIQRHPKTQVGMPEIFEAAFWTSPLVLMAMLGQGSFPLKCLAAKRRE